MPDAEIYVDRIADMRINDRNTVLEATRQMVLLKHGEDSGDLYLHALKVVPVQEQLTKAMNFEGSSEGKKVRPFPATLGIDDDKLTKEQFVTLIDILKLSKRMKNPVSQRERSRPYQLHGKGKKKQKQR